MATLMGIVLADSEIRQVPKHGLTLEEVGFAMGSADLVRSLREIGALMPAQNHGRTLLFDAGDVARAWAEFRAGKYGERLKAVK